MLALLPGAKVVSRCRSIRTVGGPPQDAHSGLSIALPAVRANCDSTKAPNARNALPPRSLIGHSLNGIHALIARKSENETTATGATRASRTYRSMRLFIV